MTDTDRHGPLSQDDTSPSIGATSWERITAAAAAADDAVRSTLVMVERTEAPQAVRPLSPDMIDAEVGRILQQTAALQAKAIAAADKAITAALNSTSAALSEPEASPQSHLASNGGA